MVVPLEKKAVLPLIIKKDKYFNLVQEMYDSAGITINGNRSFDIQVRDPRFFKSLIRDGSLGLGESYMEQWWDCEDLPEFCAKVLKADLLYRYGKNPKFIFNFLKAKIFNEGRRSKAFEIGEKHYDVGNKLFEIMLDKRMIYTCAYWKGAKTLDEAQENKMDLICKKAMFKPGMKVLDIGCGWGGFAKFAVENYGVEVVGISVSQEQIDLGREICAGLPIELRFQDYRDLTGKFDRIVSVGMFEHVGCKNHRTYMKIVHDCLKKDGIFLLHIIGEKKHLSKRDAVWMHKYIFPNSEIPAIKHIGESTRELFVMEDWQNFGTDYGKTLLAWHDNFKSGWDELKTEYGEVFYRMWEYYLLSCVGVFRSRYAQLWQIVFSKNGISEGYQKNITYNF